MVRGARTPLPLPRGRPDARRTRRVARTDADPRPPRGARYPTPASGPSDRVGALGSSSARPRATPFDAAESRRIWSGVLDSLVLHRKAGGRGSSAHRILG